MHHARNSNCSEILRWQEMRFGNFDDRTVHCFRMTDPLFSKHFKIPSHSNEQLIWFRDGSIHIKFNVYTEHFFQVKINKRGIHQVIIQEFQDGNCTFYDIVLELKHPPQVFRKTSYDQKQQRLVAPTSHADREDIEQITSLWMCNFKVCNSILLQRCNSRPFQPFEYPVKSNMIDTLYQVDGVDVKGIPKSPCFHSLSFEIRYLLLCFNSQICGLLNCQQRVDSLLQWVQYCCTDNKNLVENILRELLDEVKSKPNMYPIEFMNLFHEWLKYYCQSPHMLECCDNSKDSYLIRKLVVTPTRIIYLGKSQEGGNYLLRRNSELVDAFCRVSFCDEDRSALFPGRFANLAHRVNFFVRIGIPLFDGRYEMLAYSSSQLRAFSYWSVYVTDNKKNLPKIIIDKLGNFSDEVKVAKRAARIGLCLTQTYEGEQVLFEKVPDIVSPTQSILSDGIGRISESYARELAEKNDIRLHGQRYIPSAFQFRLEGYKGVVVVDRKLHEKTSKDNRHLLLSHSQCKFSNSDNKTFGLVAYSRRRPTELNRQIIAVLDSNGLPEENILALVKENLNELRNDSPSYRWLRKTLAKQQHIVAENIKRAMQHEYAHEILQNDPLINKAQQLGFEKTLSHVKSHIPLKRAALLIGVLDFDGVLEENEVFIQLSPLHECEQLLYEHCENCYEKGGVVEGQVIVTRNPTLHPGDIRKLRAVNDSTGKLSHLKDVIVFSSKALISQPSKMGGKCNKEHVFLTIFQVEILMVMNSSYLGSHY